MRMILVLSLLAGCAPRAGRGAPEPESTVLVDVEDSETVAAAPVPETEDAEPTVEQPIRWATGDDDPIVRLGWMLRDRRASRVGFSQRVLQLTKIANLERLLKATPKDDPQRPALMARLGDAYIALEGRAFQDQRLAEMKAAEADPVSAAKHDKEALKLARMAQNASKNALKYFKRLLRAYPKWCRHPQHQEGSRGCMDEVLYDMAFEYELWDEREKARKVYLELAQSWKKSRYVPLAYLAFGEMFSREAKADASKWRLAAKLYEEVLKYPSPDNRVWGYAALRLAQAKQAMGERQLAEQHAQEAIDWGAKFPRLPGAKQVGELASEVRAGL